MDKPNLEVLLNLPSEVISDIMEASAFFEESKNAMLRVLEKLPNDRGSLDIVRLTMKPKEIVETSPQVSARELIRRGGDRDAYYQFCSYFSGVQNVIALYHPYIRPGFHPTEISTGGGQGFRLEDFPRLPARVVKLVGGKPKIVPDTLNNLLNYLVAVEMFIKDHVIFERNDGGYGLGTYAHWGPNIAMSLIGSAEGFNLIASELGTPLFQSWPGEPSEQTNRKEHLQNLAKQAYNMSGLANTFYVANRLLELGDARVMRFVSVPEGQYEAFLRWAQAGMPRK